MREKKPDNFLSPSPEVCVKCKGREWCGKNCIILARRETRKAASQAVSSKDLQSKSPPGVFVSWHGYPKVNFSPMAPAVETNDAWLTDDTDKWFGLPSEEIIGFRESLVRGNLSVEVSSASNPDYSLLDIQETIMASKPVEIEMELLSRPNPREISFSDFNAPMGPQAGLKKFSLAENPSVNQKIDYLVSDTDAKSLDAMVELYKGNVGVNQLHKLLSAGMLGIGKNRKFVPTRWSITAIDSNLSKHFIDERIKYFPQVQEFELYSSNYLENYYYILLVPREWGYELMEAWKPGSSWNANSKEPVFMADYELFKGRKDYAENTAGGYYAVRIALAEHLMRRHRQATALVFREIGDAGTPPLGVFKCRETARNALSKKPIKFNDLTLALKYLETKLTIPLKHWTKTSKILDEIKCQKKISEYF